MAYAGAAGVRRSQPRRKLFDKVVRELERREMYTKVPKGGTYEDEVEKIKLVVGVTEAAGGIVFGDFGKLLEGVQGWLRGKEEEEKGMWMRLYGEVKLDEAGLADGTKVGYFTLGWVPHLVKLPISVLSGQDSRVVSGLKTG